MNNLRLVTQHENIYGACLSKKKECKNKNLGVHFYKRTGKWQAQLTINGKRKHLGYYNNENEAYDVVLSYIKNGSQE